MKTYLTWTLLLCLALLPACNVAYNALPSLDPRTHEEKQAERFLRCQSGATHRWDLGSGRLEDIAHYEPSFYSFQAGVGSYANEERVFRLQQAKLPEGLALVERPGNGHKLVEFQTPPSPPGQVIAFTSTRDGRSQVGVMIAPETCRHVVVDEACIDKKVSTTISAAEEILCFRGRSGRRQHDHHSRRGSLG